MYNEQYRVDLGTKSCDCYKWDLIGIPCSHAIACIHKRDLNPMLFVHFWYKKATYLKAYTPIVHTMPGPEMWKKSTANPPIPPRSRTLPGRPKKLRHKEPEGVQVEGTGTKRLKKNYIVMTCRFAMLLAITPGNVPL